MQAPPSVMTVLVTGAASGIGLATVEALLTAGGRVIAIDHDPDALASLRANTSERAHCELADVTNPQDVKAAIGRGVAVFGPLDGLVNSAAIALDLPALDTDPASFRRTLDVNLTGSFLVACEAARQMAKAGGSIVNITSVSGLRGNCGRAAYGASKAGLDALSRVLAVEWASRSIRVNAIAPGPIDTPLARRVHTAAVRNQWLKLVPSSRYGAPEEVVSAILFLLNSSQSSYITGQTLAVDGGFCVSGLTANL